MALVLAAAVSSCEGQRPVLRPSAPTSPVPREVTALDFTFEPASLPAQPSKQVTLGLTNKGTTQHNFSIAALEVDTDVAPGETLNVIFVAPAEGPVEFFCKFHQDRGMKGTLNLEG
jgi:plastocyanin